MTLNSCSTTNDRYILPGDDAERERLVRQNEVVRVALGGNPIIAPVNRNSPLLVLDAGTGPGSWIEDVSKLLPPHAILHGIDINAKMFPAVRPYNSSFSVASVLDLPSAWNNRFDFVHQRLLVWALSADEWRQSLTGAFRILHPGGWMQIAEPGIFEGGGECTARMWNIMREVLAFRNLRADIVLTAPALFHEIGFREVGEECHHIKLGRWAGEIGVHGNPEREFDELVDGLQREWDAREGMTVELRVVYGRKPDVGSK
ncbi:S-adenosyl-L-methionine-dependent methyltransferase [Irpex lacteus]|nr:S-adenosyl-L-methionine-dependent methyltransferase [Irpex lacteus]